MWCEYLLARGTWDFQTLLSILIIWIISVKRAYGVSKAGNILHCVEFARKSDKEKTGILHTVGLQAIPRSVKLYLFHLSQPVYLAQAFAIFKEFPNLCADFFRCCLRLLAHLEWDGVSLVLSTLDRDKSVTESQRHGLG